MSAEFRTRIEHVDTDATGIVHFSRYTSLMETAGTEHLEAHHAGLTAFSAAGVDLVAADLRVTYLNSAVYRDVIVADTRVDHVGAAWFALAVRLLREEEDGVRTPLVTGDLVFAAVDPDTRRAVPLPAPLRQTLRGMVPDAAHRPIGTPSRGGPRGSAAGYLGDRRPGARTPSATVHRPGSGP
ncbi:acyl-CoA thioesterase [Streptomyces noursei]|uniref:acyl-CoA thioesterase n=1 Tax=Streptomyces noursei TaxID=1971 RepID=UPI0019630031|nr:thioesterase family protein [Streptomyces noursei]QRX89658.1 acyl-CoA thioesterase [Streptomyces noursei]